MKRTVTLGVFTLAMMNVAAVFSLRGLPMVASEAWTMFFYVLFSVILFLVPVSLVAAELATGWPQSGGVFRWVKEAFGTRWGFLAVWLQWIQNVIWYPVQLGFVAGCFAYLFMDIDLANVGWFVYLVILVVYWGATFANFRGVGVAGRIASVGVVAGTIFPGIVVIGLGAYWLFSGNPLELNQGPMTFHSFIPDLTKFSKISLLAGIVLMFAGMEVGAVHVRELKNPSKDYPKALIMAAVIIILVLVLGSLAVAFTVPGDKISYTAGVMQSFEHVLKVKFNMPWAPPILGGLVAFGAIASIVAWVAGPSKGLLATREYGAIPRFMQRTNRHGVQRNILLIQGSIVTILGLVYLVMKNPSNAFVLLSVLASLLYMIMYVMMYAAAIKLRISQPNVPRAFKVPGGLFGMFVCAGLGLAAVLFAIVLAWFPPAELKLDSPVVYILFLLGGLVVLGGLPLLIYALRKPDWVDKAVTADQD